MSECGRHDSFTCGWEGGINYDQTSIELVKNQLNIFEATIDAKRIMLRKKYH